MRELLKVSIREFIILTAIIMLYLSILPLNVSFIGLIDDIIPLIFGIVWGIDFLKNPKTADEKIIFFYLFIICMIGLFSNLLFGLIEIKYAFLDMFSFLKMFFVYLGTNTFLNGRIKTLNKTMKVLSFFSKIFIIAGFIFALLNYFGFVKMYENMRYGLKNYHFVYANASQYGILVGVALAFVLYASPYGNRIIEAIALITMIFTLKGMALIIVAVYIVMNLTVKQKVKAWQIVMLGLALMFVLRYQIYTYLLDETAPRSILLRYGCVTANTYFPLGSGFGTYGSDIAGRYYSPLYIKYGFSSRNAFIYDYVGGTALDDAYLGMAIGQFGWIGAAILIIIFSKIGIKLFKQVDKYDKKSYITIGLFVCLCGMAVMAGSIKGTSGQLILFAIQLFSILNHSVINETTRRISYEKSK